MHAAVSVAGVAAALAAIAAADHQKLSSSGSSDTSKEAAMASAAALVAAECAKVAEAMGAKRSQLKTVISSAMSGTNTSDILTLTAAASTCNSPPFSIFLFPQFTKSEKYIICIISC